MDIIAQEQRSALMSQIHGKGTKPELIIRRLTHGLGFRFRLHRRDLPGTPDLVFPRFKKVVFVHGCFWHRHEGCRFAYMPKSNVSFWRLKFSRNVARDAKALRHLRKLGWGCLVIWECELEKVDRVSDRLVRHLKGAT